MSDEEREVVQVYFTPFTFGCMVFCAVWGLADMVYALGRALLT